MRDTNSKKIYKAEVTETRHEQGVNFLEFDCGVPVYALPGQFVSVYCSGLTLRRPFSVFSNNNGRIGILFKERGKGTAYLKSLNKGSIIDVSGVFGNGFEIKPKKSLLLGAGIGIAPIAFLKTKLDGQKIENILIAGFRTKSEIPAAINADRIYTDDGSSGEKGSVLNFLGQTITEYNPEIIYACGPDIVLKIVSQTGVRFSVETQISMEKVMACSIGVCRGCVISAVKDGKTVNVSVCKDGPVFKGEEIVWPQ